MAILFPYFELAASLFILFMAFETISRFSQTRIGRFFSFLALLAFLSAIFEYSVRVAMTLDFARNLHRITGVLWAFLFPLFTVFCARFTKHDKMENPPWAKILLFGPPTLVACLFFFTDLMITRYEIWNIGIVYQPSAWYASYFISSFTYVAAGVAFLVHFIITGPAHKQIKKKQALIIALGTSIALIIGSLTDEILPLVVGQRQVWPTGIFMLTLMFAFVYYAMRRYSLFAVNPALVAETIIETMPDALIVTDLKGRVRLVNDEAHKYFHAPKDDIIGHSIKDLFEDKQKYDQLYGEVVGKGLEIERFQTNLCDPLGECLPSLINAKTYHDTLGVLLGIVFVIRDVRG